MNVLIVYAHPEPTSFTVAMKDAAKAALEAAHHQVEVSDLYAEGFNPVAGWHDFEAPLNPERFHYQSEQMQASKAGTFSAELKREQARLEKADLFLFVFPIWWGGLPAILKGWFDRVCAYGVSYADGKRFEHGYYLGGRAIIGLTSGGPKQRFSDGDVYGEIDRVLYPVRRCMLEYLGLEVMPTFAAYGAPRADDAARKAYLDEWVKRVVDAANDKEWHARMGQLGKQRAENRKPVDGAAWAARR